MVVKVNTIVNWKWQLKKFAYRSRIERLVGSGNENENRNKNKNRNKNLGMRMNRYSIECVSQPDLSLWLLIDRGRELNFWSGDCAKRVKSLRDDRLRFTCSSLWLWLSLSSDQTNGKLKPGRTTTALAFQSSKVSIEPAGDVHFGPPVEVRNAICRSLVEYLTS